MPRWASPSPWWASDSPGRGIYRSRKGSGVIEAASELLQGHRYTPEWWSRTRDIRRHSCVRTPQFRSRAVEWTRRAIWGQGRKCCRGKHRAAPLTQPVGDPTGWSTKMTARPITTAGSRPRRTTRQSVGRVPRLLLGKGKQITRLPRSHKARTASANANAITTVAVRTGGRVRGHALLGGSPCNHRRRCRTQSCQQNGSALSFDGAPWTPLSRLVWRLLNRQ